MVKICQISTGTLPTPSGGGGGVENTVHYLSTALVHLGHDVLVIDVDNTQRTSAAYEVVEVRPAWRDLSNLPSLALRGLTFQVAVAKLLRKLLLVRRFDVVHFHGQLGAGLNLRLARSNGALTVFSSHNATWSDSRYCLSWLARWKFCLEVDALHRVNGVICDSEAIAANLSRYFGVPQHKIVSVPIAVDEGVFEDAPVSQEIQRAYCASGGRLILNVARLAPYKDQLTLVRAMGLVHAKEPDVRLVLVGPLSDMGYVARVKKEVSLLGLERVVSIVGEVPRSDLLQMYQVCDAFVLCSVRESQGLSLTEAMAKGKPVIATAIPSVLEVVPPDGGMIVPPANPEQLGRAIIDTLRNPGRAVDMARRAREHVHRSYRWTIVASRTIEAYRVFGLQVEGTISRSLSGA